MAIADVNGDGILDLLVANPDGSQANRFNGTVCVLLGNGDGTFQTAVAYDSGGDSAESVAVTDINLDEKPDLVVANRLAETNGGISFGLTGNVGVLLGKATEHFKLRRLLPRVG